MDKLYRIFRLLIAACMALASVAQAQEYPTRNVTLIVPFAAGGGTDLVARPIAEKLREKWGQAFVIENRGGAGGNIAAEIVYKAPGDGYTLLFVAPGQLAINRYLYAAIAYDPDQFVPVSIITTSPNVLVVHPSMPIRNVRQLIAFAKANPNRLSYGSSGVGTTTHLASDASFTSFPEARRRRLSMSNAKSILIWLALFFVGSAMGQPYFVAHPGAQVIGNAEVVAVYWGTQNAGLETKMNSFYSDIAGSTYLDWLSEYSLPGQPIGRMTFKGGFSISHTDSTHDTVKIARSIDDDILGGKLPFPNANTIYFVHFGPTNTAVMGTNIFGQPIGTTAGHCAYHFTARTQIPSPLGGMVFGPKLRIVVLPNPSIQGGSCLSGGEFKGFTTSASHELVESITDPDSVVLGMFPIFGETLTCALVIVPSGTSDMMAPRAWESSANPSGDHNICSPNEIADECPSSVTYDTAAASYQVQQAYSNRAKRCITSGIMGDAKIDEGFITGWAVDPDRRSGSATVHVRIDSKLEFNMLTDVASPDVKKATGFGGMRRFKREIPMEFWDGRFHTIEITGSSAPPGNDSVLLNSSFTLNGLPDWLKSLPSWF